MNRLVLLLALAASLVAPSAAAASTAPTGAGSLVVDPDPRLWNGIEPHPRVSFGVEPLPRVRWGYSAPKPKIRTRVLDTISSR